MCGKCEGMMSKGATGIGLVSTLLAIVSRALHFTPGQLGPRSFAGMAALMFLLAIAVNTCPHSHGGEA